MSARHRLPHRRPCVRYSFQHGGFSYEAALGFRDTGEPAEIFLAAGKAGTQIEAVARDAAVLAILALQHGATVDTLRHALTRLEGGHAADPVAALLDRFVKDREAAP